MSITGYKRLALVLATLALVELVALWKVAWHDTHGMWDVRDARLAVRRIEKNREAALRGTVQKAASCLQDIATCYVPWKWHRKDLHLGDFVEERRAAAMHEIILYLRRQTGEDFGDSAEPWIQQYASKQEH
jgi:hypothetical protein